MAQSSKKKTLIFFFFFVIFICCFLFWVLIFLFHKLKGRSLCHHIFVFVFTTHCSIDFVFVGLMMTMMMMPHVSCLTQCVCVYCKVPQSELHHKYMQILSKNIHFQSNQQAGRGSSKKAEHRRIGCKGGSTVWTEELFLLETFSIWKQIKMKRVRVHFRQANH